MRSPDVHSHRGLAQQMSDPRRRIAPPAIDQPFVADRFVALDQPPEESLHLGMRVDDRVEILGLADHAPRFGRSPGCHIRRCLRAAGCLRREAQRDDLPPAGVVGLELGEDPGADEHDFVARRARFAEGPARIDLDTLCGMFVEQIGKLRLKPRGNKSVAQRHTPVCGFESGDSPCASLPAQGRMSPPSRARAKHIITYRIATPLAKVSEPIPRTSSCI